MVRVGGFRNVPILWIAKLQGGATPLRIGDDCEASACRWLLAGARVYIRNHRLGTSQSTRSHLGNAA